jgi:two-component system sensor histidine kinase AlgZ
MPLATDAFGFELRDGLRSYLRIGAQSVALNQIIALPVALVLTAAGVSFPASAVIASIYSHSVGTLCAASSVIVFPWLDRVTPGRSLAGLVALYFLSGVTGAEIARRLCGGIYGSEFQAGPAYVSWAVGATMAILIGAALRTVRRLRARLVSTELEALQARINPHFLFNTLNSIAALIREDPVRAEAMTLQLSSLFRYTLTAPRRGLVTLDEELTIVEGYLAIEQGRLGPRLTYTIDVDPPLRDYRLPALTLQPLVENAVKHGIASALRGGSVRVRGWSEGGRVHITIADTGTGDAAQGGTGEGLENVRRRLRATFGAGTSVTLTVDGGTTEARVTFPAREATA